MSPSSRLLPEELPNWPPPALFLAAAAAEAALLRLPFMTRPTITIRSKSWMKKVQC